jgi:hypothetical protein
MYKIITVAAILNIYSAVPINVAITTVNDIPLIEFANPINAEEMIPNTLANIMIQGLTGQKTPNLLFLSTVPTENSVVIPLGPNGGAAQENLENN